MNTTTALRGRRIAIIGGAGFIGHSLALSLRDAGADVDVIDSLQVNNLLSFASGAGGNNRELYLRIINERLTRLINDLLAYALVDAQDNPLEETDCHVPYENAVSNLKASIEESGATLTCDKLPRVKGDQTQLVQLFQNLIGNALKFMRDARPAVHVGARLDAGEWVFSVSDNGIGIDQKYTERIFAIFRRLHHRDEYPGTGIGLPICQKIVERHGGRIWVTSEPGKGSTFFFTLPAIPD